MEMKTLYEKLFAENFLITTDSRKISPGAVFFALTGDNFNGNRFAAQALEKGCSYAVIDQHKYKVNDKCILVDNVLLTLQKLANYHRKKFDIPIIAVTGTNGKTTTKELITHALSTKYRVKATKGNLNNHIGVPLTLFTIDAKTEIAVVEMGANHIGEIAALCTIAQPGFGLITNIGKAHLEGFGSLNGVIQAKGEMYDYIAKNNGNVFMNADNKLLNRLISEKNLNNIISYGKQPKARYRGEPVNDTEFATVKLTENNENYIVKTRLVGSYNFENIMAAIAVARYFMVSIDQIIKALESYVPENNRSQYITTGSNNLIMDAYNANPTSMKTAIQHFAKKNSKKTTVILGDMLELGEDSEKEHKQIVELILSTDFNNAFFVGNYFLKTITDEQASMITGAFANVEQLANYLQENPLLDQTILIKGSRKIQLEKLVEKL